MELLDRHRQAVAPMLAFDPDIIDDTAQGIWVTDMDGNRWADFACGTAVTNLGHNHPAVVAAAHEQLDKLMHSGCVFRYRGIVELAEALRGITPKGIEKFGFANSGSEAVEEAIKLARYTTKRQGVMAFGEVFTDVRWDRSRIRPRTPNIETGTTHCSDRCSSPRSLIHTAGASANRQPLNGPSANSI